MQDYKEELKQYKKQKRSEYLKSAKNKFAKFNVYKNTKERYLLKNNKAPDVSTITEHIAFVIDDQVVEIIHCQPKMAAILLSEPKIIKIPDGVVLSTGWGYKDDKFISPDKNKEITVAGDEKAVELGLPTFKEYQQQKIELSMPTFKEYIEKLKEKN